MTARLNFARLEQALQRAALVLIADIAQHLTECDEVEAAADVFELQAELVGVIEALKPASTTH